MRLGGIIAGFLLIAAGIGLFIYYDQTIRPEREALELVTEGKMLAERGDKDSINGSINVFTRIIAKYQDVKSAGKYVAEAYFLIAGSYEKLGLNRLAYIKYTYLLKSKYPVSSSLGSETRARIARLKVLRQHTEEGVDQMLGLLHNSSNNDFRSRVYAELGHTYLTSGDYKKSLKMFDIALSENGANEEAILGKARAYKRTGEDIKAYELYEYFLKYYGNFSSYSRDVRKSYLTQLYDSGRNSYSKGAYTSAVSYFARLINYFSGDPKSEDALYWTGESYYSMGKYDSAVDYFNRTLSNGFSHRDQSARIKKGYAYFMNKKFDLAAREFQIYINTYPKGKYITDAFKWKDMSTKEIMYRIHNKTIDQDSLPQPEENTEEPKTEEGTKPLIDDEQSKPDDVQTDSSRLDDDLENVAEL